MDIFKYILKRYLDLKILGLGQIWTRVYSLRYRGWSVYQLPTNPAKSRKLLNGSSSVADGWLWILHTINSNICVVASTVRPIGHIAWVMSTNIVNTISLLSLLYCYLYWQLASYHRKPVLRLLRICRAGLHVERPTLILNNLWVKLFVYFN